MSAYTRNSEEITDPNVGRDAAYIAAQNDVYWHLDNLEGVDTKTRSVRLDNTQLVDVLNNLGVGGATVAETINFTLTAQNDVETIDLTSLTNGAVSQKNIIPSITESGNNLTPSVILQAGVVNGTLPQSNPSASASSPVYVNSTTAYVLPSANAASYQFVKVDLVTKTFTYVGATLGSLGIANADLYRGVYDPVTNKIVCTSQTNINHFVFLDVATDTVTATNIQSSVAGATTGFGKVAVANGHAYAQMRFRNGATHIVAKVNMSTELFAASIPTPVNGSSNKNSNQSSIYDPVSDRIYFPSAEGNRATSPNYDMWILNPNTDAVTSLGLGAAFGAGYRGTYNEITILNGILYVGGNNSSGNLGDLFAYDIGSNTPVSPNFAGVGAGQYLGSIFADTTTNKLYIFGYRSTYSTNIWEYDQDLDTTTLYTSEDIIYNRGISVINNQKWLMVSSLNGVGNSEIREYNIGDFLNPALPAPFASVIEVTSSTPTSELREAAIGEDYDLDYSEDGSGNLTELRVKKLKANGERECWLKILTSNAF